MGAVDDIKSTIDLNQIAGLLGTDRSTADQAVDQALEQLVGAMDDNVASPDGARSLANALGDHVPAQGFGQVDVEQVDTTDGEKIVGHVFDRQQIQTLGSGAGGSLLQKLLPILAPIVMSYLASRLQGYVQQQAGGAAQQRGPASGGGLGDLLGDLLGGGQTRQAPAPERSGGGLGDLLGDLLGGQAGAAPRQAPAPQQPGGAASGPFNAPPTADTGLHVPQGGGAPQHQAPTSGQGGDVLGGLLSDLLRGRR